MGKYNLMEEKAVHSYSHKFMDSLEEKVSVFLDEDFLDSNNPSFDCDDDDDDWIEFDESGDGNLQNSMERTLFWESQEALLQELLERNSLTGSKLRQEINRIIQVAKGTDFCNCLNSNSDACISCLRQRVVHFLCQKGFNAALCTSKWKRTKKFPGGKHEYIEVIASTSGRKKQIPYLIELEFSDQFEMAKACEEYRKLVSQLPKYYIGKADYLNAIVGVVCESAKRSMKEQKIHMGPWRKRSFMQMKWSNSSAPRGLTDESSNKSSLLSSRQSHDSRLHSLQ
eukprot:XP_015580164.1 uncharacterized protein LOC8264993 [Ricinus communis]